MIADRLRLSFKVSRPRSSQAPPPLVLPRRREPRLDPRLRGETTPRALPGRHPTTPQPPRRRPGPSWGTVVTKDSAPSRRPYQLDPGLRRGGARDAACTMLFVDIVQAARKGDGTTPAKAGAQLGDGGNKGHRVVTATSPPGPRPPPGRCKGCGLHDAICRYSTSCPQGDGTTPARAGAQLGDGGNERQRAVTATFPSGPRPPPGW